MPYNGPLNENWVSLHHYACKFNHCSCFRFRRNLFRKQLWWSGCEKTRNRTVKHHAAEGDLYMWICDMYNKRTKIKCILIKSKAYKLMSLYNEWAQPGQHIEIKFSDDWLCSFKARWGLRTFKSYGECVDANGDVVQIYFPGLRQRLANFSKKDIFNSYECGWTTKWPRNALWHYRYYKAGKKNERQVHYAGVLQHRW